MKKSDVLKKLAAKKYANGGKKTFTRPKGWEKTIQRSHFDPEKTFSGEDYEDIAREKEEESGSEKKKKMLESLKKFFNR